jgi:hypothetical protein
MKIPEHMMKMLRGRYGLESDDTSKDRHIREMSPEQIVRECAGWKLGDPYWAKCIAGWMNAVGAKPENF